MAPLLESSLLSIGVSLTQASVETTQLGVVDKRTQSDQLGWYVASYSEGYDQV